MSFLWISWVARSGGVAQCPYDYQVSVEVLSMISLSLCSCWLSLKNGAIWAFVAPALFVIVVSPLPWHCWGEGPCVVFRAMELGGMSCPPCHLPHKYRGMWGPQVCAPSLPGQHEPHPAGEMVRVR